MLWSAIQKLTTSPFAVSHSQPLVEPASQVATLCDTAIWIDEGRIKEKGPAREVTKQIRESLKRVFHSVANEWFQISYGWSGITGGPVSKAAICPLQHCGVGFQAEADSGERLEEPGRQHRVLRGDVHVAQAAL